MTDAGASHPPAPRPSPNRLKLVEAACALMSEKGYAATGTEEIVKRAGVTRGALYYQFEDKRDLFLAVCEELMRRVASRVWDGTMGEAVAEVDELSVGCRLLLDYYSEPEIRRVLLLDGPAVLGWETWRDLQQPLYLGMLRHALEHLVEAGRLAEEQVEPLSHLLFGALIQASVAIANADDPAAARDEFARSLDTLVANFTGS